MPPLHSEFEDVLDSDDELPELLDMTGDEYPGDTIFVRARFDSSPTPARKGLRSIQAGDAQMQEGLLDKQSGLIATRRGKGQDEMACDDEDMRTTDPHNEPDRGVKPRLPSVLDELADFDSATESTGEGSSVDITTLSSPERQHVLQERFSLASVSLVNIGREYDQACSYHLGSGDRKEGILAELLNAYLDNVKFHIDIWPKYDTAAKQFYWEPQRLQDCGLLRLDKHEREALESVDWGKYEIRKVMFRISSPFRGGLMNVILTAVPIDHSVGCRIRATAKVMQMGKPHLRLTEFVRDTCDEIGNGRALTHGMKGFQLADIDELAAMFVRKRAFRWHRFAFEEEAGGWYMA